ncbi:hypothetical protein MN116_008520 [Schistosoma mekongi]|uniref:WH2 domain-containing protein n=1 Tax=Schistosoma mekongi TaxID=38744 RepID=A0AAE1Z5D9_SCHME|nr:hypothetical protein MN116_008520 [Schistosoma mekongi]
MSIRPPPIAPQFKSTQPPPKQVSNSSGPAFLADIKAGRSLRKVPDSEKKDRSAPFTSKEANRNNESSVTGPTPVASGNIPPVGLPNPFANGVPKLKSVGSVDVTRSTAQIPTTKQPTFGYVKSPAPPPPQTSPPPSPPPTSSAVQSSFPSSTIVTTVPPTNYYRPSQTTNNATAVRNGLPAPPTPARPVISKNNSNYPRYNFYRSSSIENNDPVVPNIIPSPPIQVTLSSLPTPSRIGAMTVHKSNNNISSNNDNSSITATTAPPPPSGRSPRRKQSSSNRYQRAGSTNADVNGIPVGQSTKVIRISSHLNGDLTDYGLSSAPSVNPSLPSSVHDMNTMSSRAHPIPPPPPPIQPAVMNSNNMHSNNIAGLVRHFESRFTFPDIGHVPVPKAYHGPKTYRVGSNNNNNNNNNAANDSYHYSEEFSHLKEYNHSNISTFTISNYNNNDRESINLTEQLLYQVMNENSVLREKNEELREIIYHEEDNSKMNELSTMKMKLKETEHELIRTKEENKQLKSDNILLNNLIQELNDHEVDDSHSNEHECSNCEYFKHQLNAYIYLYGELNHSNVQDILEHCLNEGMFLHSLVLRNFLYNLCIQCVFIFIYFKISNVVNNQRMNSIPLNENLIKSPSDYSISNYHSSNESTSTNECKHPNDTKSHNAEGTKSSLNILIPSRIKCNKKHKWKLNSRKHYINFNNCNNYNQNKIDHQMITSNDYDDNQSSVTCSKLKVWKYSNNTPKLKLINDYRISLIKSRKRAIQLLNTQNKLPHLSEIQCSYELLNQRNNSLLQQYQVMRKLKIQKDQSNHELNSLVESLSSILHRSRKQNIRSKRIIENLKTYLYKLYHTINQFIMKNDQDINVHDQTDSNKLLTESINSKKSIRQFFHHINQQLQEVINNKQIEQFNMKTKITTLENEAKRRRQCIQELRLRHQNILNEQINLRNELLTKEKTNETLKYTEIHLQQTIKTQRIQLQSLINEKKQMAANFYELKQAHHNLLNELNELKVNLMNIKKSKQTNLIMNSNESVKQTKIVNRICFNNRVEDLEKFILIIANELIKTIHTIYQLCNNATVTNHDNQSSSKQISSNNQHKSLFTKHSLQIAKKKAAEILCLSLDELEKLTFLEEPIHEDNHGDYVDGIKSASFDSFNTEHNKEVNEVDTFSKVTIHSYLENLSQWPLRCERLLKDFLNFCLYDYMNVLPTTIVDFNNEDDDDNDLDGDDEDDDDGEIDID